MTLNKALLSWVTELMKKIEDDETAEGWKSKGGCP